MPQILSSPSTYKSEPDSTRESKATNLLSLQLIERVKETSSYLIHLMTLFGILMTTVLAALGASIWKTHTYSKRLVDEHVGRFKQDVLPAMRESVMSDLAKASEEADSKVKALESAAIELIADAFDLAVEGQLRAVLNLHKSQLKTISRTDRDQGEELERLMKPLQASKDIWLYLLLFLSLDEVVVQDVCQKLFVLAEQRNDGVVSNSEVILKYLRRGLSMWPSGGPTRRAIESLIVEIERSIGPVV
jgi:hypothetical protein